MTPPEPPEFSPVDGANISPDRGRAFIEFSEPIATASLNAANFRLEDSQGNSVPLIDLGFDDDPDNQIVRMEFGVLPQDEYRIIVRAQGVTDLAGNPLGQADLVSRFTNELRIEPGEDADIDPDTPGIQVVEGSTVFVQLDSFTTDSLPVVQLLFNDVFVRDESVSSSELAFTVPISPPGPGVLNVKIAAMDAAGNARSSNTLTFEVLDDVTPPLHLWIFAERRRERPAGRAVGGD